MSAFVIEALLKLSGASQFNSELSKTQTQTKTAVTKMSETFDKLAKSVFAAFSVKVITDFSKKLVTAAAQVRASNAQFEATFKEVGDTATETFNRVANATGVMATRLRVAGTKAFSQFKGAGLEANEALEKTETYLNRAADAAAYYDISLEEADTRLRSFIRGNVEAGDMIGLFTSESQRNAKALELYGQKYVNLNEAQKQMTMLNIANTIYEQSGALGQAARESGEYANQSGNLAESWLQLKAALGDKLLEATIPIMQKISSVMDDMTDKVKEFNTWIDDNNEKVNGWLEVGKNVIIVLGGIVAGLTGLAIIKKAISLISSMKTAFSLLNVVMAANPIGAVVVAIAALVGAFASLYATSDKFRKFWDTLWDDLRWTVNNFIDKYRPQIEAFISYFTPLKEELQRVFGDFMNEIGGLGEPFLEMVENVKTAFTTFISWFSQTIYPHIKPFIEDMWVTFKTNFETAWDFLMLAIGAFPDFIGTIFNTISGLASAFTKLLSGDFSGAWEDIKNIFSGWESFFSDLFSGAREICLEWADKIGGIFGDKVGEALSSGIDLAFNTISSLVDTFTKLLEGDFNGAWENIKGIFSNWGSFFSGLFDTISTTFQDLGSKIGAAFGDKFKGAVNIAIDGIEWVINKAVDIINGIIDAANFIIPFADPIGKLDKVSLNRVALEEGGEVTKPTNALIGEAGKEAVIPLEDSKTVDLFAEKIADKMSGGSTSSSMNISEVHDNLYDVDSKLKDINGKLKDLAGTNEDWSKSTETINQQIELLNSKQDAQNDKMALLNQEYRIAVEESGEMGLNAQETKKDIDALNQSINETKTALSNAETALKNFSENNTTTSTEAKKTWDETWNSFYQNFDNFVNKKSQGTFSKFMEQLGTVTETIIGYFNEYITPLFTSIQELVTNTAQHEIDTLEEQLEELENINEKKAEDKEKTIDEEKKALKTQLYEGKISYAEYVKAIQNSDDKLSEYKKQLADEEQAKADEIAKKKDELARRQFESQKATSIAQVWVQAALGIMQAFGQLGPIAGAIAAAVVTATAGVQTAAIAQQQYVPAFAKGGIVDKATYSIIGEDGKEAVVPLENNTEWVGGLAKAIAPAIVNNESNNAGNSDKVREEINSFRQMVSEFFEYLRSGNREVVIDGNVIAKVITPYVNTELGKSSRLRARGV